MGFPRDDARYEAVYVLQSVGWYLRISQEADRYVTGSIRVARISVRVMQCPQTVRRYDQLHFFSQWGRGVHAISSPVGMGSIFTDPSARRGKRVGFAFVGRGLLVGTAMTVRHKERKGHIATRGYI